jgi:PAS domain-containing protein
MRTPNPRFYTLLVVLGCAAALIIGLISYLQFYNMTRRYNDLTQTSYHTYIEHLVQDALASTARYIEKQFPVLHDTERLKKEARAEWFWETSRELTGIAENFNFAYIYYIEKTDSGYIFLMSSGINKDEHPEWLHGPVWAGETPAFIDKAWETQQLTFSTEPTVNEWGTLISAELPIINNGVVAGILGIDYNVSFLDELRQEENLLSAREDKLIRAILRSLIISAAAIILVMGVQLFVGYRWVLVPVQTREAEEQTKAMLDATLLACTLWDENANMLDCNQEALNLLGLKKKIRLPRTLL